MTSAKAETLAASITYMVGVAGFELATYWSQSIPTNQAWRGLAPCSSNRPGEIVARIGAAFGAAVRSSASHRQRIVRAFAGVGASGGVAGGGDHLCKSSDAASSNL